MKSRVLFYSLASVLCSPSDGSAEAFAETVKNAADDQSQIDALTARVDTLEKSNAELAAELEALRAMPISEGGEGGLTATEVVWIRTVIQKYHTSEQPPAPVPVE